MALVSGGEEDTVEFAEQNAGADARRGRIGVKKATGDVAGLERGELGGRGGLGQFEADAGMETMKLADDRR